jgi:hypothetical protein
MAFKLRSPAFGPGGAIPLKYVRELPEGVPREDPWLASEARA